MKIYMKRIIPGLIVLLLLIGIGLAVLDWSQIKNALAQASLQPIPYALVTTLISYTCISLSFAWVNKLLGIRMRLGSLVVVGFLSTVLNHMVASGGAAGYSVRYALMNRHGVSLREVLAVSILHFYLTSLVMIGMLPVGLIYLLLHASLSRRTAVLLAVLVVVFLLAAALATGLVFLRALRARLLNLIERAARTIFHHELETVLERFEATMSESVAAFRQQPLALVWIMALIMFDWSTSAATLWFCYRAMTVDLTLGQLITGFVIGILAGVTSMIPGGLGVQEGSMAGVLALLGVPFEAAVLASIIFRLVYFIIPYLISLGFYTRLLRKWHDGREIPPKE
jgi:uncharacterized protein (TIRG00374 family)